MDSCILCDLTNQSAGVTWFIWGCSCNLYFGIDVYTKGTVPEALEVCGPFSSYLHLKQERNCRKVQRSCCETALWMCVRACVCASYLIVHSAQTSKNLSLRERNWPNDRNSTDSNPKPHTATIDFYTLYFYTFLPTLLLRMNFSQGTNQISVFDVISVY